MNLHYDIKKQIAILGTSIDQDGTRWYTELNLVSWNDRPPIFDLRSWDETHTKMQYGVKLDQHEIENLYKGLQRMYKGEIYD